MSQINANYEFQGFGAYIDRGYLKPNKPLGIPTQGHQLTLP